MNHSMWRQALSGSFGISPFTTLIAATSFISREPWPERKRATPEEVDRAIIDKYRVAMSKYARHRQRQAGAAAVAYYRHGNLWVMVATCGSTDSSRTMRQHQKLSPSAAVYRGIFNHIKADKLHVQLTDDFYRELRGYLVNQRCIDLRQDSPRSFMSCRSTLRAVQRQLRKILREVNAERKSAGMPRVPGRAIPCRLRVFG